MQADNYLPDTESYYGVRITLIDQCISHGVLDAAYAWAIAELRPAATPRENDKTPRFWENRQVNPSAAILNVTATQPCAPSARLAKARNKLKNPSEIESEPTP